MLSIIICTIKPNLLADVKQNIADTIGIAYELILIDNTANRYSLSQAYNLGATQSSFSNLLFLHDDVAFHTQHWGQALSDLLSSESIGLIGISGAVYKSTYPSTWSMIPEAYYRIQAIQKWKDGTTSQHIVKAEPDAIFSTVAVIDGVFLAMRKAVWNEFPFDEINLKGFHLYDTDISLRVGANYSVIVSHEILLEHFSEGTIDQSWIKESISTHKRLKAFLPKSVIEISTKDLKKINHHATSSLSFLLIKNRSYLLALKYMLISFSLILWNKTNRDLLVYFFRQLFQKTVDKL